MKVEIAVMCDVALKMFFLNIFFHLNKIQFRCDY